MLPRWFRLGARTAAVLALPLAGCTADMTPSGKEAGTPDSWRSDLRAPVDTGDAGSVISGDQGISNGDAAEGPCELTCPGCCAEGDCFLGTQEDLCGSNGEECRNCAIYGQSCTDGACEGGCTPFCGDKCAGEDDGCGGTCSSNGCSGCCDSSNTCQSGTADSVCGSGGVPCENCLDVDEACSLTAGACMCVPSCSGKCPGADDGCGGTCYKSLCMGCCDSSYICQSGNSNTSCGNNGATCVDCTLTNDVCAGSGHCM